MQINELWPNIQQAVTTLRTTSAKKINDGVITAYWVGHVIRVDIDSRELNEN